MSWRAIQSTVPHSESLARLTDFEERLFWRMVSQADPWGRLEGSPIKVRARCCPLLSVTNDQVTSALENLVRAGRLQLYIGPDQRSYCQLLGWDESQPADVRGRNGSRYRSHYPTPDARSDSAQRGGPPADSDSETENEVTVSANGPSGDLRPHDLLGSLRSHDAGDESLPHALSLSLPHLDLAPFLHELEDADSRTGYVLLSFARDGLPEAAFHSALEALQKRRQRKPPLQSEARYFVATLKTMTKEGTYAR